MFLFLPGKVCFLALLCLVLGLQPMFAAEDNLLWSSEAKNEIAYTKSDAGLVLAAPSDVKIRPSLVGALSISWNQVPSAQKYIVEYAGSANGIFKELATVNAPLLTFRHTGLSYGQTVYYRIKAVEGNTASAYSTIVSGTTNGKGHIFKIMPLGDSNTKGSNSKLSEDPATNKNEPLMYGYRKALFQLLTNASVSFDFVGSEKAGTASRDFSDYDHAGFGGARVGDIGDLLQYGWFSYYESKTYLRGPGGGPYLDKYNPDIVLLHIGTNWVNPDAATVTDSLQRILNQIDAYEARANKEVTVVLARIIKRCVDCTEQEPDNPEWQNESTRIYNERLWEMAQQRIARGDRLIRVDMETGAGLKYTRDQGGDMLDYLHLTEGGYAKMAKVWFDALKADLTVVPPPLDDKAPETTIVDKPSPVTSSTNATFSFSSNEQDVVYQLSLNGGAFALTTNPRTLENLADGTYTIAVRAIDAADNIDPTPATYTWVVDTRTPAAPVITAPANNTLLKNAQPVFTGTAEALSIVTVLLNGETIGTTTADAQGGWTFKPARAIAEGSHKVSATATDVAGNTSAASSQLNITLDLTPPAAPAILSISEDTGSMNNDQITSDNTLIFSGSTEAGAEITLSESNLGTIGTITATNTGTWSYSHEKTALAEKVYTFKATAKDKAGNVGAQSSNFIVRVDRTAPTGYSLKFNTNKVELNNMKNIGLQVSAAEIGARYFYSITSENGGAEVNGSATASTAGFSIGGLDLSGMQDGELTAFFYMVDVAGNKGADAKATVIKVTKDIIAVQELSKITVPFKTMFSELDLLEEVEVSYSDNTKEMLAVTWQQGNYNGETPAEYQLRGTLDLKPNTSNSANRIAVVTVEVEPNKPPTAITLSESAFQPDITSEDMIGVFTTTDPDDTEHTYALVSGTGDTDNDLFEIRDNGLYLKSNRGPSGLKDFTIRVQTTDPYANPLDQEFKLKKEPYNRKVNLINAFSPDDDGINDTWVVTELRYFDAIDIQVFDRSGARLFHTTDPEKGWDGRNLKGDVKQGSYFYIISIKDIDLVQKGVLTVIK